MRIILYGFLILFVFVQIILMKYIAWVPDFILLMVVFNGIFFSGIESAGFGLIAGVMRTCFSTGTLAVDIFLFPAAGFASSLLGGMFYRQNSVAQMFTTLIAVFMVITGHTLYLNFVNSNDINVFSAIIASWKCLVMTVCISPFFFAFLKKTLRLKEDNITKKYEKK